MSEKTLIDLIEEILSGAYLYKKTDDTSHLVNIEESAMKLGERLGCSPVAAMCLAFILSEVSYGRLPTRTDIIQFLPVKIHLNERLNCLWELIELNLVLVFKPVRKPFRCFYMDQSIAEAIANNRVPNNKSENLFPENKSKIKLKPKPQSLDYEIHLSDQLVGIALLSAKEEYYDVYWRGKHVFTGDSIDDIKDWLNHEYVKGRLSSTQD